MRWGWASRWMLLWSLGCGGTYEAELGPLELPAARISLAGSVIPFPDGQYFLDVGGVSTNGSAPSTGCQVSFGGCYALTPSLGDTPTLASLALCPAIWDFSDSTGAADIQLRDTALPGGSCDYDIPPIATCAVDGTFAGLGATAPLVEAAQALTPGYRVRMRPGDNVTRLSCTLSNASVTFDVSVQ